MEPPAETSLYTTAVLFVISLIFCAIFSFLETSITAARLFKVKEFTQGTTKYRTLLTTLENKPNRILIAILVAYNFANVIAAILSGYIMEQLAKMMHLSDGFGFAVGVLITSTTILIADLIPKNLATQPNNTLFKSSLWMTNILYLILSPFVSVISKFTDLTTRLISGKQEIDISESVASEKEIKFLIDYINEKGLIETQKTSMLKSIFELSNKSVKEIMVPETDIISINVNNSQEQVLDTFTKYQLSRLPVYEDNFENIIGMLHQKDFFQMLSKKAVYSIKEILRPIMFVPENTKVLKILKDFREQRMHLAIVLNEFGGVIGLITLEDVLEEIVGEINDEHEASREKIITLPSGGWLINATIELKELSKFLNIEFDTKYSLTLGGFLTEHFQHLPKKGEEFTYKNFNFQIHQASQKRIYQVLVFNKSLTTH